MTASRPPRFGRSLLRVRSSAARRAEFEAELLELFESPRGVRYAKRRYYADVLSLWTAGGLLGARPAREGARDRRFAEIVSLPISGLLIVSGVALAGSRALDSLRYGLPPTDPLAFGAAMVVLLASALSAIVAPVRRGVAIHPASALLRL